MNFFGVSNNTLSIILYIVTILVLVIFGIVVSTTLKNYINNIPEKKRTFLQKFLSDTVARNIIIIGGAFLILKFIIDPLFNYIFPAIAIGGSLLGGNDNDDQKDIEINTNNFVENNDVENNDDQKDIEINTNNNDVNNNLVNIELPQSLEHMSSRMRIEQQQNELANLSRTRASFMEPLQTRLNFTENDDEKTAEISENTNIENNDEEKTAEISENNNVNNEETTAEISENNNVNNEETTPDLANQSISNLAEPFPLPRENNNEENIVPNVQSTANNDEEKDSPQTGGTKKTRGRPKKIKSAAKVKLGKTNKWAIAVKRARKALGLTGFVPLSKGGLFYKTSKSFYYELTH